MIATWPAGNCSAPNEDATAADATSVVWGVLMAAQKAKGEEIDVEVLDLPGVPEDAYIEELPAMKVEDVRGCVESIARVASQEPNDLLEAATERAHLDSVSSKMKAEQTEGEIKSLSPWIRRG
jgi:hypothetical protein